ncbi:hypothetical protein BGX28_007738 [Mortierella sp. GBA30]|nr:hypothetical protein BGX28_007738 [Mortierella sp. GBA30]
MDQDVQNNRLQEERAAWEIEAEKRRMEDSSQAQPDNSEIHIANRRAESEVAMNVGKSRRDLLTGSTNKIYDRYQKHWSYWCQRRRYPNDNVESMKFLRYMSENLGDKPDDENHVYPLRKCQKFDPDTLLMTWDPDAPYLAYETVDSYVKAAVSLYRDQMSDMTNTTITENTLHPRSNGVETLLKKYRLTHAARESATRKSVLELEKGKPDRSLRRVMDACWLYCYPTPVGKKKSSKRIGLRTRLDHC